MSDQRNLLLAIVISVAILFGYEFISKTYFPPPEQPAEQAADQAGGQTAGQTAGQAGNAPVAPAGSSAVPLIPGQALPAEAVRDQALNQTTRVRIETPSLSGSINLKGARIDDLVLTQYDETLEEDSGQVTLLSPNGSKTPYYAEFGWAGAQGAPNLPNAETIWTPSSETLTPDQPVTLRWDNSQGQTFLRTISVDEKYMFTVNQRVENNGDGSVALHPYGLISRKLDHGSQLGLYILHEGPIGVLDSTLVEHDYSDISDDQQTSEAQDAWLGITDKYWLTALAPRFEGGKLVNYKETEKVSDDIGRFQSDYVSTQPMTAAPGAAIESVTYFFAGAKKVFQLEEYRDNLGITDFHNAVDWGWFFFLTQPFFKALHYLYIYLGNYGVTILVFTVLVKLVTFPLANKSYTAMSKMKKLQPEMKKLQERFGDDKMRLQQEMMALYKREKASPVSGCLPILIQIPIFFALYKVLFVSIEMRHAPFFGWIDDLSAADPTNLFNLFGLIPWDPPSIMHIGVWPLVMGATMYLQQKLNPQPTDPLQAKIMSFLPLVFTIMLAPFPAGLVIYWAWNNLLSIAQQWVIMRKMGVKVG